MAEPTSKKNRESQAPHQQEKTAKDYATEAIDYLDKSPLTQVLEFIQDKRNFPDTMPEGLRAFSGWDEREQKMFKEIFLYRLNTDAKLVPPTFVKFQDATTTLVIRCGKKKRTLDYSHQVPQDAQALVENVRLAAEQFRGEYVDDYLSGIEKYASEKPKNLTTAEILTYSGLPVTDMAGNSLHRFRVVKPGLASLQVGVTYRITGVISQQGQSDRLRIQAELPNGTLDSNVAPEENVPVTTIANFPHCFEVPKTSFYIDLGAALGLPTPEFAQNLATRSTISGCWAQHNGNSITSIQYDRKTQQIFFKYESQLIEQPAPMSVDDFFNAIDNSEITLNKLGVQAAKEETEKIERERGYKVLIPNSLRRECVEAFNQKYNNVLASLTHGNALIHMTDLLEKGQTISVYAYGTGFTAESNQDVCTFRYRNPKNTGDERTLRLSHTALIAALVKGKAWSQIWDKAVQYAHQNFARKETAPATVAETPRTTGHTQPTTKVEPQQPPAAAVVELLDEEQNTLSTTEKATDLKRALNALELPGSLNFWNDQWQKQYQLAQQLQQSANTLRRLSVSFVEQESIPQNTPQTKQEYIEQFFTLRTQNRRMVARLQAEFGEEWFSTPIATLIHNKVDTRLTFRYLQIKSLEKCQDVFARLQRQAKEKSVDLSELETDLNNIKSNLEIVSTLKSSDLQSLIYRFKQVCLKASKELNITLTQDSFFGGHDIWGTESMRPEISVNENRRDELRRYVQILKQVKENLISRLPKNSDVGMKVVQYFERNILLPNTSVNLDSTLDEDAEISILAQRVRQVLCFLLVMKEVGGFTDVKISPMPSLVEGGPSLPPEEHTDTIDEDPITVKPFPSPQQAVSARPTADPFPNLRKANSSTEEREQERLLSERANQIVGAITLLNNTAQWFNELKQSLDEENKKVSWWSRLFNSTTIKERAAKINALPKFDEIRLSDANTNAIYKILRSNNREQYLQLQQKFDMLKTQLEGACTALMELLPENKDLRNIYFDIYFKNIKWPDWDK